MRLRLAHHFSTSPDGVGGWTWHRTTEGLKLIPELQFLQNWHVTRAGILAASAFGGMKDVKVTDLMHPGSVPERLRGGQMRGWHAKFLDSKAAEASFRLAMRCGYVSQHIFDCLTT